MLRSPRQPAIGRFLEAAGWYGMLSIVSAYGLLSLQILSSASPWYQALNLSGALGLVAASYHKRSWQVVVLNVFWAGIAFVALLRLLA